MKKILIMFFIALIFVILIFSFLPIFEGGTHCIPHTEICIISE